MAKAGRVAGVSGQMGVVKSWNGAKGFGFITCDGVSGDVFFSRNELPADAREVRGTFLEGRTVQFDATEGPDGRQKASAVHIPYVEGQPLAGSIKSFSEKNGYGFITSSALSDDVRFGAKDLPVPLPGAMLKDELVTFDVQARPDGKLMVSRLQFQTAQIAERVQGKMFMGMGGMPFGGQAFAFSPPAIQRPRAPVSSGGGGGSGIVVGKVKSYSDKNGYGFLIAPGNPADIKFNRTDIVGVSTLAPGTTVSFGLVTLPDGRVQAKEVSPIGGSAGVVAGGGPRKRPASAMSSPFGYGGPAGGSFNAPPAKQARVVAPPQGQMVQGLGTPTGEYANGLIKSYNATKGFGFITSPSIDGDVFFMRSSLVGQAQHIQQLTGASVGFQLVYAPDGKVRAQDVTVE